MICLVLISAEPCYKRNDKVKPLITSPLPHTYLKMSDLPETYDLRNISGKTMVTATRNQHIPGYCGACWSFAATSSLNDRMKLATNGKWPEVDLSMQVILNCDKNDDGCHGGDPVSAFEFIKNFGGIPDETCHLYEATGHDLGATCEEIDICKDCSRAVGCWPNRDFKRYTVSEYGRVVDEEKMMAEIYARGPIACSVAVPQDFFSNYTGGIYEDKSGKKDRDHSIEVAGWGVENGVKYWIGRNSWGTFWGEQGWFRIIRGKDNLGIETDCSFAVPVMPKELLTKEYVRKTTPEVQPCKNGPNKWARKVVTSPLPHTYLKQNEIPKVWDWRNVSGYNYMTWTVNQHIPEYCGSCWAQAVASIIGDRLAIQRKGAFPQIDISPQVLLNCNGGGTCFGGSPDMALDYINTHGISDSTCAPYEAKEKACQPFGICYDCTPNATSWSPGSCWKVEKPHMYTVSEFGDVKGVENMKAEIFSRGPISCGITATTNFHSYDGGIYSEASYRGINHEIEVLGWGIEDGQEYWIGRNSWGTYWGVDGYFYIKMHSDNLNIETDCSWAIPKIIQ